MPPDPVSGTQVASSALSHLITSISHHVPTGSLEAQTGTDDRVPDWISGASGSYPPQLRRAVRYALEAQRPVCTLKSLAVRIGCSRSTLWRQWRDHCAHIMPARQFLRCILLVRFTKLRSEGHTNSEACRRLGVDLRIMRDIRAEIRAAARGGESALLRRASLPEAGWEADG